MPSPTDLFVEACLRSGGFDWPPSGDAAWPGVLHHLTRHGLAPMAAAAFAGLSAPDAAARAIKMARTHAALAHRTALNVLAELAPRLRSAGIACAVLKGPHLYAAYYDADHPRVYGDIDLLVGRRDVDGALAVLSEIGYRAAGHAWSRRGLRRFHFHLSLRSERPGLPEIELHWALVDRVNLYRVDDEAALGRARPFAGAGVEFPVLSPEDTFLYLCLHTAKHGLLNRPGLRLRRDAAWFCAPVTGNRLIWFCDLWLLLRGDAGRIDWSAVADRCREWNVTDDVAACLAILGLLLPDCGAAEIAGRLGIVLDAPRAALADRLLERLATARWFREAMDMHAELFFRPARLLFVARLLFPPPAELRAFYRRPARWTLPVLYLQHPFVLAARVLRCDVLRPARAAPPGER